MSEGQAKYIAGEPLVEGGWIDDEYPMPDEIRQAANQIVLWLSREKVDFCSIKWNGKIECGITRVILSSSHMSTRPERICNKTEGYVYLLYSPETNLHKIGMSKDAPKRVSDIAKQAPGNIDMLHVFWSADARNAEKTLHDRNAEKRVRGEWFRLEQCEVSEILGLQDGAL